VQLHTSHEVLYDITLGKVHMEESIDASKISIRLVSGHGWACMGMDMDYLHMQRRVIVTEETPLPILQANPDKLVEVLLTSESEVFAVPALLFL